MSSQQIVEPNDLLRPWLGRWGLTPDGPAFRRSTGSVLMPVLKGGAPAMLKVASDEVERRAAEIMVWYAGEGAARVILHEDPALLMERLAGDRSLVTMATSGHDDEATQIICGVVGRLHAPRGPPPGHLPPLSRWFAALEPAARREGGVLAKSAAAAARLLAEPRELVPLHGDIHHRNILDGAERGWLAIDPRGAVGERGFDYANLFANPDIDDAHDPGVQIATSPETFERRLRLVAKLSGIDARRLALWALAYAGLSAAWTLEDGEMPEVALAVARLASATLEL